MQRPVELSSIQRMAHRPGLMRRAGAPPSPNYLTICRATSASDTPVRGGPLQPLVRGLFG